MVAAGETASRIEGRRLEPWGFLAWSLPAIAVALSRLQVTDLAYQIRAGRISWATQHVLRSDVFTYTVHGAPWLNQQWGAQLVFAGVHALGGWRGLFLLQLVLVTGSFGAVYRRAIGRGAAPVVAATSMLGGFIAAATLPGALALRPQLLALPLFLVSAWLIQERERFPRAIWVLPAIGVAWANLHGSFVLLTLMLAIATIADLVARRRRAWTVGALTLLSLATPLITPWGAGTYRYLVDVSTSPVVGKVIAEWQPVWRRWPAGAVFAGLVVLATALLIARRARPTLEDALTLAAFTALPLWSGRSVLWWAAIVPPIVGGLLRDWTPGSAWSRAATRVVAVTLGAVLILGVTRIATRPVSDLLSDAPAGVTTALGAAAANGERVFAARWGGWFEYALPDVPMFTDPRVELFPDEIWGLFFTVREARTGWQDVLDAWAIDVVVVDTQLTPAIDVALASDPGWREVYRDGEGAVFVRAA